MVNPEGWSWAETGPETQESTRCGAPLGSSALILGTRASAIPIQLSSAQSLVRLKTSCQVRQEQLLHPPYQ
jgi:hypothetical protein